jgi:aspartyl-tRNA(Asn)/glutamyl-tRNA(Gln) amidotransferase subunit A
VRNPVDPSRIAGGSSGGSGVAVAMSQLPVIGLGTDTGGSVRIPAALCGVCGFKPTFGLISTAGVLPLSATLDHVGLMTKNMADMRIAFSALTDKEDLMEVQLDPAKYTIGIPEGYFFENSTPEVEKAFSRAIEALRTAGFIMKEGLEIQGIEKMSRTRITIQMAEGAWFYQDLVRDPEKRKLVGKDVMSFFDSGSKTTNMELLISSQERISLMAALSRALQGVDFLAMPTCLTTAPKLEDILGREAGSIRRQLVRNTEPFNLCGLPSLTIPCNDFKSSELPVGIELSGRSFDDQLLLEAGDLVWKQLHGN